MPMPIRPGPRLPEMPDYSSQFEKLGETLGGFGEQLGGFGKQIDALGSFNEQVGGSVSYTHLTLPTKRIV